MNLQEDIFIFIGPPGSGKGSLSELCSKEFGWKNLSIGNLCRSHVAEQTEVGKEIDFAIKSGKLVSDTIITQLVVESLEKQAYASSIIFDGYPRTVRQAQIFYNSVKKKFNKFKVSVVRFLIEDEVVVSRLCYRYICQDKNCQAIYSLIPESSLAPKKEMECDLCGQQLERRSDDAEEAIRERLRIYHKHEQDLLNFYYTYGQLVHEINVSRSLSKVFGDFKKIILYDKNKK